MSDNLPQDFRDVEQSSIVGEDSRSLQLTHYVLAERLLQCEYALIAKEIVEEASSETLTYILEGGFRGFHKYTSGELWAEWQEVEEKFYHMYETNTLPWELFEEDPLVALEEDENGEVKTYGQRLGETGAE
jgi:hypothetical protein